MILNVFRIVAPEFKAVIDDDVTQWIDLTKPLVSKNRFGTLYEQAVALLAAHRMKIAGSGEDVATAEGGIQLDTASIQGVTSYSEGSTSISFNTAATSTQSDSDLLLTTYGQLFLSLRRKAIVPIICSGEAGS